MLTVVILHSFVDINIPELVPCTFSFSIPTSMFLFKLKHLSGNMHMYKLENPITPEQMSYHESFLLDTFTFSGIPCASTWIVNL